MAEIVPISNQLYEYIETSNGWFYLVDIYRALNVNEEKDKTNIRVQCHIFAKKGILVADKHINGRFRKVDDVLEELDIVNADPGVTLDINYPFDLQRCIQTMPKELVVIAGSTGAGKSAYLLNFCLENIGKHEVFLFTNTEMTASRIRKRFLDHPEIGKYNMSNLHAYQREDNFADVMKQDGINVIDYLEVSSERPSSVGDELAAIHNALKGGMAIVAIQKKAHTKDFKGRIWEQELGVGGEWSKRKAGVYLTIDHYPENKLVIRKCRERTHDDINPINLAWKFKLVKGISFCQIQDPDDLIAVKPSAPEIIEVTPQQEEMPW